MKLTLKTQQMEMRSSFSEVNVRIDNLSNQLDVQRKETDFNFRQIEASINKVRADIANALSPYLVVMEAMLENHEKRIRIVEQR